MPTRKISDYPTPGLVEYQTCTSVDHLPPPMVAFEPGLYEHTCPTCGHVTMFSIPRRNVLL